MAVFIGMHGSGQYGDHHQRADKQTKNADTNKSVSVFFAN